MKTDVMVEMGIKIKKLRLLKDMSQNELAKAIDEDESVILQYEAGKGRSNLNILFKLAKALNTTSDYLLGLKN